MSQPSECRNCKGVGYFTDARFAGVTHRRTAVKRTCRYCKGSGQIVPPPAPEAEPIGEIPEWMLEA